MISCCSLLNNYDRLSGESSVKHVNVKPSLLEEQLHYHLKEISVS